MNSIMFGFIAFLWCVVSSAIVLFICPRLFRYAPRGDE